MAFRMGEKMVMDTKIKIKNKELFLRESKIDNPKGSIIMLHGYSFSSKNWLDIGAFKNFNDLGFSVFAPDYPGFGNSSDIEEFSIKRGDISNAKYFVKELMDALHLTKAVLLGPSMGGGMALLSASLYPERFEKLILVGPAWFNNIDIGKIELPKLFIWGEKDDISPLSNVKDKITKDHGSKLEVVKGAGHPVYLDKPSEFFKIVNNFITEK
ncbi:alpha/beta fold hydrolase [Cuniculiplasma sp. SKW4]|uniref:alpha/beta fold hydrolase n=1 Tax=Cuniculiplasma sp. SKW4 TaxID=3400171 RepID=UPI003FD2985D